MGFNQAEVIEGARRQVICSGQTAVDEHGAPQHPEDMRAQISLALDNLETVLSAAGMSLANVTKLGVYATDMDAALANFDLLGQRFGPHRVSPPMTLLGVTRLALPGLLFEIEATAAD
jgi:enamine deaminase RidA (YjgF/YER057c/UK114 family)